MRRLLFALLLIPAVPQSQQSSLPPRRPVTETDLYDQLGRCHLGLAKEREYQQELIARIRELEAQLLVQHKEVLK